MRALSVQHAQYVSFLEALALAEAHRDYRIGTDFGDGVECGDDSAAHRLARRAGKIIGKRSAPGGSDETIGRQNLLPHRRDNEFTRVPDFEPLRIAEVE